MATAARSRYGPTARPKNDAYTGLLFISFLALVASCIFLYLDYDQYGKSSPNFKPEIKAPGSTGALPAPAEQQATPPMSAEPMGMGDMSPAPMPMGSPMPGTNPMSPIPPMPMGPMSPGPMSPGRPSGAGAGGGATPPAPGKPPGTSFDSKGGANSNTTSDTVDLPPLIPAKSGSNR